MIAVTPNIDALQPPRGPELDAAADQTLPSRFARGDARAFDELVATYRPRVTRLAYRLLGWKGDVEDVVQEVFLAALKHLGRFRGQASLNTWLTAITVNACRSRRRRLLMQWRFFRRARNGPIPESAPAADQSPIDAETFACVRSAVQALPARDREVIVLHYLEHLPADEIAALLRVSRGAIEVRLHRARQRLKTVLGTLIEEKS
jgi:RNA polymerase sigma-70 factor (ECF subfamily)